jgi:hypothetical protein
VKAHDPTELHSQYNRKQQHTFIKKHVYMPASNIIFLRPSNILLLMTTIKKIIAQSTAYGKRQCHLKQLVKKRNIKKLKKALHLGPSIEGKRKKD